MRVTLLRLFYFSQFLFIAVNTQAQEKTFVNASYSADSAKSGNSKDILTNFFQLALNNLIGENKEISFNSNPYAIMLKRNPSLSKDIYYKRYSPLRRLNINFGIRLDSAFNFNGFSSGLKYSLIDMTDASTSKYIAKKLDEDPFGIERDTLADKLFDLFNMAKPEDKKAIKDKTNALLTNKPLDSFDPEFQKLVLKIVKANNLTRLATFFEQQKGRSLEEIDKTNFEYLKNSIKKNLLWTISVTDSTYKDKFELANIAIVTELSKGIFEPEPGDNNLEVNIKAMYTFSNDTVRKVRNLDRKLFSFESGLNWVIRNKTTDQPFFEIKFSGSYYRNFGNLYLNEKRDSLTINGTARIRVYNDIWIPLEVKYDPKTGKIHGFLNIKANFAGLAGILKGKK